MGLGPPRWRDGFLKGEKCELCSRFLERRSGGRGGREAVQRALAVAGGVARWPRGPHSGGRGGGQPKDRLSAREQPTTPSRQMATPNGQDVHISRGIRPTPPSLLVGGGGWRSAKTLDIRAFLALRQFPRLAGRGGAARVCRVCVCKNSQAPRNRFFPPMRVQIRASGNLARYSAASRK